VPETENETASRLSHDAHKARSRIVAILVRIFNRVSSLDGPVMTHTGRDLKLQWAEPKTELASQVHDEQ